MDKDTELMIKKTEAFKGLVDIINYMAISPNTTKEVIVAFDTIKDWLYNE